MMQSNLGSVFDFEFQIKIKIKIKNGKYIRTLDVCQGVCPSFRLATLGKTACRGFSDLESNHWSDKGMEEPPGCQGLGRAPVRTGVVLQYDDSGVD
jgi:hypothetical protein